MYLPGESSIIAAATSITTKRLGVSDFGKMPYQSGYLLFAKGAITEESHINLEREISDLKEELEHFQQEKERVRGIIGKIGGVPKFHTKLIDAIFIVVITASVVVSIVGGDRLRLLMIELAIVSLSLKIIYLIHCEMRINHFEFWILSSIEWRINEIMKQIRQLNENR